MGITAHSIKLIEKAIELKNPKTVVELGAQNLYNQPKLPAPYASEYYKGKGIEYTCIDLSGENNSLEVDLGKAYKSSKKYDLVTDFGTSEHIASKGQRSIKAFYNCWANKHNLAKVKGVIISENPKTGSWGGHGFNYLTKDFYTQLAKANGYEIVELGEDAAMNNTKDGWNVYCILVKKENKKFMPYEDFKSLPILSK